MLPVCQPLCGEGPRDPHSNKTYTHMHTEDQQLSGANLGGGECSSTPLRGGSRTDVFLKSRFKVKEVEAGSRKSAAIQQGPSFLPQLDVPVPTWGALAASRQLRVNNDSTRALCRGFLWDTHSGRNYT